MRKFHFFALAVLVSTAVFAQDPKFGLKGGLNLANLTNVNGDLKAGFHFGALAHVHITPAFSLQPEAMFSTQGARYSSGSGDQKTNLSYINVPVLLQYNFDNGFRLQGGPQIGFLVEAKYKNGSTETDISNQFKTIDFSVPVGLSYLGYSGFGADLRYNIGVSNIVKTTTTSVRNSVIQLGVFYLFDHKHKAKSR